MPEGLGDTKEVHKTRTIPRLPGEFDGSVLSFT